MLTITITSDARAGGKTTLARALRRFLESQGLQVLHQEGKHGVLEGRTPCDVRITTAQFGEVSLKESAETTARRVWVLDKLRAYTREFPKRAPLWKRVWKAIKDE